MALREVAVHRSEFRCVHVSLNSVSLDSDADSVGQFQ